MNFLKQYKFTIAFFVSVLVAGFLFYLGIFERITMYMGNFRYAGSFFIGMMFSSAFTTPSATLLFVNLGEEQLNPFFIAFIGAIGAVISDLLFYEVFKKAFVNEAHMIMRKIFSIRSQRKIKTLGKKGVVRLIIILCAGCIIASPLPDEIGIALFSAIRFKPKYLSMICFLFNMIGIFILVRIGNTISL